MSVPSGVARQAGAGPPGGAVIAGLLGSRGHGGSGTLRGATGADDPGSVVVTDTRGELTAVHPETTTTRETRPTLSHAFITYKDACEVIVVARVFWSALESNLGGRCRLTLVGGSRLRDRSRRDYALWTSPTPVSLNGTFSTP